MCNKNTFAVFRLLPRESKNSEFISPSEHLSDSVHFSKLLIIKTF